MRIVVVGINHAGTSAIRTLLSHHKGNKVVAYDRNSNISFLGCGIALTVGGIVQNIDDLFYSNSKKLEEMGANIFMKNEVVEINTNEKFVKVKDLDDGKIFEDSYDKLIYAGGSWPIEIPHIPEENKNLKNIEICKLYQHAKQLINKANDESIKSVAIVGAGYIGIELAEAFAKKDKRVTLIDFEKRVLPRYYDREFTDKLEKRIVASNVRLALGEKVVNFKGSDGMVKKVVTDKGEYDADLVVQSIGFVPNTDLLPEADKTRRGAITVDEYMRTSIPDVYAIGDCAAFFNSAVQENRQTALATNALKSGIVAASHINGEKNIKMETTVGTNAISVFGAKLASTGINETTARMMELNSSSVYFEDNDRPEFMDEYDKVGIKLVFDEKSLRLLGAQIGTFNGKDHTEVIYYLALAIQKEMTLHELAFADVYFLPHFNKPFNFVLSAVLKALGMNYL